jgi:hypothetical protein
MDIELTRVYMAMQLLFPPYEFLTRLVEVLIYEIFQRILEDFIGCLCQSDLII